MVCNDICFRMVLKLDTFGLDGTKSGHVAAHLPPRPTPKRLAHRPVAATIGKSRHQKNPRLPLTPGALLAGSGSCITAYFGTDALRAVERMAAELEPAASQRACSQQQHCAPLSSTMTALLSSRCLNANHTGCMPGALVSPPWSPTSARVTQCVPP